MRLAPNWRAVLRHAWSVRLIALAALLSGLEVALPFLDGFLPIPTGVFAGLSALTTAAAFIARLVAQSKISGDPE
ncbi:hypothetical protein [Pseudaminobacter soli (ex Li et al. 2025)]|uniref:Uncharacterized protein n=1 Tax=Pseudaminobacter soli (ex Li et al. 2025) TaxID=1295366 RepID=A0A2P7SEE9_9HYPH|nr:hypothetical protein [Mesorhizobium soli]PSJ60735.1 hypothetical protein C7I85_11880 [Mesorhizobium soli]